MASVEKRSDGRWRARWREFPGGPQKSRHFDRKADADRFVKKLDHDLMVGAYVDPSAGMITLKTFADRYVERQPWRVSTRSAVGVSIDHLVRIVGDRPIGSIRPGDLQAFVAKMSDSRQPSTVKTIHSHVSSLFAAAVQDRLLVLNPATGLKLPRPTSTEIVPPTPEHVAALLAAAPEGFRAAVVLGAGLGLRLGEASGLTLDRVDFLRRTVRVDRQLLTPRAKRLGPPAFGPPKTTASTRTVPSSDVVLEELAEHVKLDKVPRAGFILARCGEPLHRNAFAFQWKRTTERAGLPDIRYHDLRHHFASALISAGCSVRAVQSALGHDNAATTLATYSHLFAGDEDRIRTAVDQAWRKPAEDQLRTGER